jgi:hypothetical protein
MIVFQGKIKGLSFSLGQLNLLFLEDMIVPWEKKGFNFSSGT